MLCGMEDPSTLFILKINMWDFPSGPAAKTPHSQCRGAQVQALVRGLDATSCNQEFACLV